MASGGTKIRVDIGVKNALQTLLQHAIDVGENGAIDPLIAHLSASQRRKISKRVHMGGSGKHEGARTIEARRHRARDLISV